jgi:predicted AAA+ superfamily ATPase
MDRAGARAALEAALRRSPAVGLVGARQVGKTTLVRAVAHGREATWFDLEDPIDVARLDQPMLALEGPSRARRHRRDTASPRSVHGAARARGSRPEVPALFLGSAFGDLLRQSSESLAGRITFIELSPSSRSSEASASASNSSAHRPKVTRSMRVACADLKLDHLYIVVPGSPRFPLDAKISVAGIEALGSDRLLDRGRGGRAVSTKKRTKP